MSYYPNVRGPAPDPASPNSDEELIASIIQDVCELPDYTSPDDNPDLLQCTVKELELILRRHLLGEE